MKRRLKILSLSMGLLLLFCNVTSIYALEPVLTGDTSCVSRIDGSLITVQINSSTAEYRAFGTFNVKSKCVINTYVQSIKTTSMPLFAGKQNVFNGAINLADANSNIHQGSISLKGYVRPYYLVIK